MPFCVEIMIISMLNLNEFAFSFLDIWPKKRIATIPINSNLSSFVHIFVVNAANK